MLKNKPSVNSKREWETVRIDGESYARVKAWADKNGASAAQVVAWLIAHHLDELTIPRQAESRQ